MVIFSSSCWVMDAIRKKMQSLKAETDGLYATIKKFDDAKEESDSISNQVSRDKKKQHTKRAKFSFVRISKLSPRRRNNIPAQTTQFQPILLFRPNAW